MQNWKKAEKDFEGHFAQHGKGAFVHRLTDTATAKATAGNRAFIVKQPSDYHVVVGGQSFYAEVKSSSDRTSFHFSNVQKGQLAASRRIEAAGGAYFFFIKSEERNQWFRLPATVIHTTLREKKSLRWDQMEAYKYEI